MSATAGLRPSPPSRTQKENGLTPRADAEERFDALYRETLSDVYAYCTRRVGQRSDVDDIVATVYASVWRRVDDALAADVPLAWIYGIARRTIANHQRGRRRTLRLLDRATRQDPPRPAPDPSRVVEQDADVAHLLNSLQDALDRLKPLDREIVLLSVWEQLSHAEIGEVVGLDARAVSSRLYRARRQLGLSIQSRDISNNPDTTPTGDKASGDTASTTDENGEGGRSS